MSIGGRSDSTNHRIMEEVSIMKKKLLVLIALLTCSLLLFTACGDKSGTESGDSGNGQKTVFFGLKDMVKCEGLCEMSDLYAEVLDDAAVSQGWYYYYTDSDQNPAEVINWKPADGKYTTVEVLFTAKNISDTAQTFGDKIKAQMFYQENKDADTEYFDGTVFQQNPGQTEKSGEVIMWSTKPVKIEPGKSTQVSFRFDIPKEIYDKVYATAKGEKTGIVETCEFNFGDGTIFTVDLAKVLIPASEYESK